MCQPCGGRIPSPRSQSWLESANLARHLSSFSLIRGDPTPLAMPSNQRLASCLGPLQASMSALRCCIRSALRLRKRRALRSLGAWQQHIPTKPTYL